jgi:hypothetical protein
MDYYQKAEDLSQKALNHVSTYKDTTKNYFSIDYNKVPAKDYLKMLSCYFGAFAQLKKYDKTPLKNKADITYVVIPELERQINHLSNYKNQNNAVGILNRLNAPMPKKAPHIRDCLEKILYINMKDGSLN